MKAGDLTNIIKLKKHDIKMLTDVCLIDLKDLSFSKFYNFSY